MYSSSGLTPDAATASDDSGMDEVSSEAGADDIGISRRSLISVAGLRPYSYPIRSDERPEAE